jgi:hypothetical protein
MKKKLEKFIRNHGIPRNLVFTTKFRFSEIVSKFPENILQIYQKARIFYYSPFTIGWCSLSDILAKFLSMSNRKNEQETSPDTFIIG